MTEFLGKTKSGRSWREPESIERASNKNVSRGSGSKKWDAKVKEREEAKQRKMLFQEALLSHQAEVAAIKKRRAEKKQRRIDNTLKNTIVQRITNSRKVKRMKRNQRKSISLSKVAI